MSEDARVAAYGKVIWETSRADEGTISATGANIVARAVMTVADAERNEAYARGYQAAREHWKARAESAERARDAALAEVAGLRDRLGALADEWERSTTRARLAFLVAADELREALAVPVTGDTEDASPAAEDAAGEGVTVCGCPTNAAGDIRCHVCFEYVNVRCWNCKTPRGAGPCPHPIPTADAQDEGAHAFIGVRGHSDDDECTYRSDGTDATYCGKPASEHDDDEYDTAPEARPRRYDQCDETCTTDCGHCKGAASPTERATEGGA